MHRQFKEDWRADRKTAPVLILNPIKTMAIIRGLSPSKLSGSIGDYTYRQTKAGTIVSQKIQKKANPIRTLKQAAVRLQLKNLVSVYNAFEGTLRMAFQNKPVGWSDLNAFISANYNRYPIFLTKLLSQQGAGIVAPYQVSRGSLMSIGSILSGAVYRTDIALGGLIIGANTKVTELAKAIIDNNEDFQHGDQIAYFQIAQITDANGVPRVTVKRQKVVLDLLDNDVLPAGFLTAGFATVEGYLGQAAACDAHVYIHSREGENNLLVSTQFINVPNAALYNTYGGDTAKITAVESYGGISNQPYLQPSETETPVSVGSDVTPAAPTNVTINAVANNSAMGSVTGGGTYVQGAQVTLTATPNEGYLFSSWSNGETSRTITFTANADASYTATFSAVGSGGSMGDD